jgi:transposase InsO family protein
VLKRAGLSRPPRAAKEPANRYEWPCPGDLLHMDTSRYARFLRTGHRVTGDRSQGGRNWMRPETRVGYDYAHAIVDDHTRLAFVELHDDDKAATVTGFVERALAFFATHGIIAKRLMTDNGFSYVRNRSLHELLARHGIRHLTTQPYRPRTNGKVERFHQTMAREWAYGLSYRTHRHRNAALPPGSTPTTGDGHTAHSATGHQSAAFTTSVGRTASYRRSVSSIVGRLARSRSTLAAKSSASVSTIRRADLRFARCLRRRASAPNRGANRGHSAPAKTATANASRAMYSQLTRPILPEREGTNPIGLL